MTIYVAACFLIKDDKVLLVRKQKGFGAGRLNVPGGRLKEGETPEEGVVREALEETGLRLDDLKRQGILRFYFGEKGEPDWILYVFSSTSFKGKLRDSIEGTLEWVELDRLPYEKLLEDNRYWIPLLRKGRSFSGAFYFNESGERLLRYSLRELPPCYRGASSVG